jgi:hypothetical protein
MINLEFFSLPMERFSSKNFKISIEVQMHDSGKMIRSFAGQALSLFEGFYVSVMFYQ